MTRRQVIPTRRSRRARLVGTLLRTWAAVPAYLVGLLIAIASAALLNSVGGWR